MKSVFTLLWCIKLNFDPTCVYFTSFILDVVFYLWLAPYGFGNGKGYYNYWPSWIFFIASIVALAMAIFAIIQLITKNSSASSRHATYVQCRLYTIIGLAVGGIILFVIFMIDSAHWGNGSQRLRWALEWASPLIFSAAALHCYHENFV